MRLSLASRIGYFFYRLRNLRGGTLWQRAAKVAAQFHKPTLVVFVDMLWSAAFRNCGFQDYIDWDFAMLTGTERRTFVTNAISHHLSRRFNAEGDRILFQDKLEFNKRFDALLGRKWIDVAAATPEQLQAFAAGMPHLMGKEPVSNSGHGVERYATADIADWEAFRTSLLGKGQTLVEQYIENQHPDLAKVCAGSVNTTRLTTFFDGTQVHIIGFSQKFGRGAASDQQSFGGFFTTLDEHGHSNGPGYGSHGFIYANHPDSGASITDFQLPMVDEVKALIDKAARVVPDIRYVGWDVVVTKDGPTLLEGNWVPGAYENKPTATGIRTGSLPLFRQVMGF